MRLIYTAVLAITLTGAPTAAFCQLFGGGSAVEAQAACTASNPTFLATWACIRAKVAAGQAGAMNNAPGLRYLATGDLLAERVQSRRMSDVEARAQLAAELARGDADYRHQQAQDAASGPVICNRFGAMTVCN